MNFKTALLLFMALFVASVSGQTAIAAKSLRVGVYENAPKLTLNQLGQVSGIWGEVLAAIDSHLQTWQADSYSAYFDILRHWNASMQQESIPQDFWWLVIALLLGFVSAVLFSLLMWRRIVEKNTSLWQAQQNLNLILDSVDAHIFIKDMQQRYQYVNQNMCKFSGREQHEIIGQTDSFLYTEATCQKLRENDRRVLEEGERVVKEEINMLHGADSAQTFLTVKLPLRREDGTIYSLCGISTNMTDYLEIQKQLRRLALYDGLTGLANRYSLLEHLEKLLTDSRTAPQDGALLIVDLDAFKTLNDTLGHPVGDLLLKSVAERLQAYASEQNLVARLGADEFVLVRHVPGSNRAEVMAATQQFADTVLRDFVLPFSLGKTQYIASATIGIALFSDAEGEAKQLLQKAEIALYRAKASGRNSVCFFDPLMQQQIQRHSQLEHWLREAITLEQLELYVQPQVSSDQLCVGMEALLRWNHPEEGFIAPADFIPIAEASGLIYPLGDWVLRKACQILADWSTIPGMENLTLSVNISPRQFRHQSFVDYIDSCIAEFSVDPSYLELEVTENLLIEDIELIIERMNALRKRGLRFSLDDFGTGYASLSYLKLLPFNKLKIDQSFVQDVLTDINDEAIVSTIITLGQSLDLAVVAEGVETVEQAVMLEHYGCYVYQGYYFGKPAPVVEWQQRISNN